MVDKIITQKVNVMTNPPGPAPPQEQIRWTVAVVPEGSDAGIVETFSSSDYNEAKKVFEEKTKLYPEATVNGKPPGTNPFTDGTLQRPQGSVAALPPPPSAPPSPSISTKPKNLKEYDSEAEAPRVTKTNRINKPAVDRRSSPNKGSEPTPATDGAHGAIRVQARVNYNQVASERVIRNPDGNGMIVLGNDRWGSESTGYSGTGHTQCDRIDLVVGVGGSTPKQVDGRGNPYWTNPNFFEDAARVYISQKTDVDENFNIGNKENYSKSEAKSAVVLKADNIRLVGRESLKLVTYTDRKNSTGAQLESYVGIHLMANNDENGLQPIPRGDNLADALKKLNENIGKLAKTFDAYIDYQGAYNKAILNHHHQSPLAFMNTTPDLASLPPDFVKTTTQIFGKTQLSIVKSLINNTGFENNFCLPSGKAGRPNPSYINSRFNKTS